MIKAIALDDEPLALTILEHLCTKNQHITLEKVFTNQEDAIKYLNKYPVDLLFLDIQMPEKDGITFYQNLENKPLVVFTTAFDHYAVQGFNLEALDYLLKPISYERFEQTINKVIKYRGIATQDQNEAFILIRADYKLNKIMLQDISYIEGLDDYIQIYLKNKPKLVARMSMKNILEQLPEKDFIRIHRSYIIPTNEITSVHSKLVFTSEKEFPIGETYKSIINQYFTDKI